MNPALTMSLYRFPPLLCRNKNVEFINDDGVLINSIRIVNTVRLTRFIYCFRNLAKERSCDYVKVLASSYYTGQLMEKYGFELVHAITYADFKIDGKTVLDPAEPHKIHKLYVKKI